MGQWDSAGKARSERDCAKERQDEKQGGGFKPGRFCSMSSQILEDRAEYYRVLESTQKGSMDITEWLVWFLKCLDRAIEKSNLITDSALEKESFFGRLKSRSVILNDRQKKIVDKLFSGMDGKLTAEKWAKMTKSSPRTALRDIQELIAAAVLVRNEEGGRSTSYRLAAPAGEKAVTKK
jgi:Fic family protein